eukprot:TRINITY_DN29471_c0_g2_i1.p1 TRINITY_DN29471_c0_g2~~TRINITY_DN29471_c0_g2_i1.p1  ORF type:complete len:111 (-),score=20.53 TRINITY_DN29471_c0_g2_i1:196-528(-)
MSLLSALTLEPCKHSDPAVTALIAGLRQAAHSDDSDNDKVLGQQENLADDRSIASASTVSSPTLKPADVKHERATLAKNKAFKQTKSAKSSNELELQLLGGLLVESTICL